VILRADASGRKLTNCGMYAAIGASRSDHLRRRDYIAREVRAARADGEPTAVGTNCGHSDARRAPVDDSSEALSQAYVRHLPFLCVRGRSRSRSGVECCPIALLLSFFGRSDKQSARKAPVSVVLNQCGSGRGMSSTQPIMRPSLRRATPWPSPVPGPPDTARLRQVLWAFMYPSRTTRRR
jgi:hypothetical protein